HLVSKFIELLRVQGCSPNTLRAYENDIMLFFHGIPKVTKTGIAEGLGRLGDYNVNTRCRKLSVVKNFLRWIYQEKFSNDDYSFLITSGKSSLPLPDFLSVDETLHLWKSLLGDPSPKGSLKRIVFLLMYAGG